MSINLFQTGISGLLAAQQQLATTGHNIANVNTEGYSRQRAEQSAIPGVVDGGGTYIKNVARVYSEFTYKEQLHNQSSLGKANADYLQLNQLNDIMSFSGASVMTSIEQFYQAMNGIADNPSDLGLRSIALSQAEILSSDFRSLDENLGILEQSTNGEIEEIASEISQISLELAKINEQILFDKSLSETLEPNDLLDTRDRLVNTLGKYTSVKTVTDANGVMTVIIGQGTTLVAGITPLTLGVTAGNPDPLQVQLQLNGPHNSVAVQGNTLGGELAAKFEFRDEHLLLLRSEINRLSMAISSTLNDAQADGLDLNQLQGNNLFTDLNNTDLAQGRIMAHSANTGNIQPRIVITDVTKVPTDEFEIKYDGVDYILTNKTDGATTTLVAAPPGTFSTPYGFDFVVDAGAPLANDTFLVRPTKNSAAFMEVELNTGSGIAASSAIDITPSDNNISPGSIKIAEMYDPVNARLAMPIRIDVLEDPVGTFNYTWTDNTGTTSAPIAYTPPSQTIDIPPLPSTALFSIEISGSPSGLAPNAPEQFFIDDAFGLGNSSNAVAMALTQEQGVLNGGKETFSKSLSIATGTVGSSSSTAKLVASTAEALFTQAYNRHQAESGVNLDEEAANLLKFQQAYQASSQIIAVANKIFEALLASAR